MISQPRATLLSPSNAGAPVLETTHEVKLTMFRVSGAKCDGTNCSPCLSTAATAYSQSALSNRPSRELAKAVKRRDSQHNAYSVAGGRYERVARTQEIYPQSTPLRSLEVRKADLTKSHFLVRS